MPDFEVILESLAPSFSVGALRATPDEVNEWAVHQTRFPQRNVAALPFHRQLEHRAVDLVLHHMTGRTKGQSLAQEVVHDANGKPSFSNEKGTYISIAHHSHGQHCWAAVALSEAPIGCDIESLRSQLQTISKRFLNPDERSSVGDNIEGLCAIWGAKESMFKAFGPSLDFRKDLHVIWTDASTAIEAGMQGTVRQEPGLYKAWRLEGRLETGKQTEFWAVCGPTKHLKRF